MPEVLAGTTADFSDAVCRVVTVDGVEIGVRSRDGQFYAYENRCRHMGGPVCEGVVVPRVEEVVAADGSIAGHHFVETDLHLVCPWHGYEYDLRTGEFVGSRALALRRFETTVRDDQVYVVV